MNLLHRQVFGELLKIFLLVVSGLTVMLVFVGVVGEATKNGLGPAQILDILPYIIPSLLPFTIPATLLLTVCVVYGRMASDNEITATKAAGINVMTLIYPSFILGALLSLGTLILTDQFIPWARANIESIITGAMEDLFLDALATQSQVNDADRGFSVTVIRVDGRKLIGPTFRVRTATGQTATVQAEEATLKFDLAHRQIVLDLYRASIDTPGELSVWCERETRAFPLDMPKEPERPRNLAIQVLNKEMEKIRTVNAQREEERLVQTSMYLASGDYNLISLPEGHIERQQIIHDTERSYKLNTEVHGRVALACSCFFFVTFGAPFSILQGRKQFLTNFLFCFVPILIFYYPLIVLGMTLGKSNIIPPWIGMWIANAILGMVSLFVLNKVLRH